MSVIISEEMKAKAEVYRGHDLCNDKSRALLTEMGLPNGLLPLKDIIECGHDKETGFVWLIQKAETKHRFDQIGKLVSYATEVTAVMENKRIKKLNGVKSKELLIWVKLDEISVDDPPTGKITFKTPLGMSRSLPISAFQIPHTQHQEEEEVKDKPQQVKDL